mgnify:CR=1 FL=1
MACAEPTMAQAVRRRVVAARREAKAHRGEAKAQRREVKEQRREVKTALEGIALMACWEIETACQKIKPLARREVKSAVCGEAKLLELLEAA